MGSMANEGRIMTACEKAIMLFKEHGLDTNEFQHIFDMFAFGQYSVVNTGPIMDMLERGWDALDQEGCADFMEADDLAPAWFAMLQWAKANPDAGNC